MIDRPTDQVNNKLDVQCSLVKGNFTIKNQQSILNSIQENYIPTQRYRLTDRQTDRQCKLKSSFAIN